MIQKKKIDKQPERPKPEKPHKVEHDEEPPQYPLTNEEEFDKIPEDDGFETPPYEKPPAGEGP